MAEITEASLKNIIAERLKAVHVEVTDMSGEFSRPDDPCPNKSQVHSY